MSATEKKHKWNLWLTFGGPTLRQTYRISAIYGWSYDELGRNISINAMVMTPVGHWKKRNVPFSQRIPLVCIPEAAQQTNKTPYSILSETWPPCNETTQSYECRRPFKPNRTLTPWHCGSQTNRLAPLPQVNSSPGHCFQRQRHLVACATTVSTVTLLQVSADESSHTPGAREGRLRGLAEPPPL